MLSYLFLFSFLAGLLLAVRLMFFGAERLNPVPGTLPLRRSEPAVVAFLVMFGLVGYLALGRGHIQAGTAASAASAAGLLFAAIVTRLAIAAARMKPEHDPDDPRYALQGTVAVVMTDIPPGGEGSIHFEHAGTHRTLPARDSANGAILAGQEVCIERIDDGVAYVELWTLVEERL